MDSDGSPNVDLELSSACSSPQQSPHAMAEEAVTAAVLASERSKRKQQEMAGELGNDKKRSFSSDDVTAQECAMSSIGSEPNNPTKIVSCNGDRDEKCIAQIWNEFTQECSLASSKTYPVEAKNALLEGIVDVVLGKVLDTLIQNGLEGFHELDVVTRDAISLNRLADVRLQEITRMQQSENKCRSSLANLLGAVEGSNNTIQDNARAAQMGASLGEEMHVIRSQREVSLEACAELTKKNSLLEEELRFLKGKLHRLTQEKLKVERDSRAAISLARSLDMHTSSDAEFYKRKVCYLNEFYTLLHITTILYRTISVWPLPSTLLSIFYNLLKIIARSMS